MTPSVPSEDTVPELRMAVMRLARRLRQERPQDDLTPSQLAVLGTLRRRGSMTSGDLARSEQVKPPSMTRMVASLEAEGLVIRRPDADDGRVVHVELTPAARERIEESQEQRDEWLRHRLKELPDKERELLLAAAPVLNRLATDGQPET